MRVLSPLVAAAALLVSGCATSAQGAIDTTQQPAVPLAASPSAVPSALPQADATLGAPPSPPVPTESASPSGPVMLAADPTVGVASGPPLPPNPYDLGGPAPVGSFVLGDSISLSAGIGPVLARLGYPVMGVVGQSASETYFRTHLTTSTAQAAPAWVIELGTNNTADPADVARVAGWVELIDSLRSPTMRQKVYWVTPHRPPSFIGSKSTWNMDAFNAELKRLDAENKWLHVIDFDAVAKAHPEWFDADTAMHLHPDADGQGVLVALIAGPDAVPVEIPAPLMSTLPAPGPEPETFDNATLAPRTPPKPTPTPTPSPTPASVTPTPLSTPAPLEATDASSGVAGSPTAVPATTDEASPPTAG